MKNSSIDLIFIIVPILIGLTFVIIPVSGFYRATTLQKTINQECNTNYSLIEVALNGNDLIKLCKVKNQTVIIK